jgi:hypothetical protein
MLGVAKLLGGKFFALGSVEPLETSLVIDQGQALSATSYANYYISNLSLLP